MVPKKEEIPVVMEEIAATPTQMEVTGRDLYPISLKISESFFNCATIYADEDQCKTKEEEVAVVKVEDKQCNNPLAGLANAVNAITNGVVGDESLIMPICAPVTVNSKQAPPKAMVKPQVLTHVIEGFVIQEGIR